MRRKMILCMIMTLVCFLAIGLCHVAQAQITYGVNVLSLDSCIQKALESNYSIKIIRNEQAKSDNNVTPAPFLPKLSIHASQNQNIANSKVINNHVSKEDEWIKTNNMSAGIALDWTIFDGMKMFTTHDKYVEMKSLGELNTKAAIENLIVQVSTCYYEVVRQQSKVEAAKHSLNLSMLRYKEAHDKYILGSLSGLEALQAKLDLNADSSNYMKQQQALRVSKSYF